ncbi:hypothetical protein D0T57_00210 [Dysgonomonas sp. 511]|nr:hypothetical protein [Dysgonomonas sp. 511]
MPKENLKNTETNIAHKYIKNTANLYLAAIFHAAINYNNTNDVLSVHGYFHPAFLTEIFFGTHFAKLYTENIL